jgi:hypothetical protein
MDITLDNYLSLKGKKLKRAEIASIFDVPEWKLKKLIAANGWGSPKPKVMKADAFSTYNENSAYWGGFLAADGCVTDSSIIKLYLNYDDTTHVEKFREFLGSSHTITSNTDKYYRSEMSFKDAQIVKDLQYFYNIVPRKSLIYTLPNIPTPYLRHYLRGYFDGDGCICESFSNVNSTTATLYTTIMGSGIFIDSLYELLHNLLGINGTVQTKANNIKTIKYCTNASFTLLDYMYKDSSVYLDRKHSLYINLSNGNRKTR